MEVEAKITMVLQNPNPSVTQHIGDLGKQRKQCHIFIWNFNMLSSQKCVCMAF